MHRRPSAVATPLSAPPLTPRHRDLASLKSPDSAPRTPTKRAEPLPVFSTNTNRYSTDSWNSSNCDGADEMTFEWKPEQVLLLTRTLDALPSHLLTPFAGPVPPSNLLDKIARGVSKAKNSVEWPHSLHATRAKIIELARSRAKENIQDGSGSDTIVEEESDGSDVPLQQSTNMKRSLYKPSSTDFPQPPKFDIKDNPSLARLSRRLQRTDRILTSPMYEPYPRISAPSLRPSTPSSTTLNSAISPRPSRILKRTTSSISSNSDEFLLGMATGPRKLRRSDTFTGSTPFPTGVKRAPSFGGSSRNSCTSLESVAMSIDFDAKDSDVTSDEEERLRSKKAKRARRKEASPTPTPLTTPTATLTSPLPRPTTRSKSSKTPPTPAPPKKDEDVEKRATKRKATFQRHPSIIGPELPNPQPTPASPARVPTHRKTDTPARDAELSFSPMHITSPYNITHIPSVSPQAPKGLKRSRPTAPLPHASLARKISFTGLSAFSDDHAGSGAGLGSAFQMH